MIPLPDVIIPITQYLITESLLIIIHVHYSKLLTILPAALIHTGTEHDTILLLSINLLVLCLIILQFYNFINHFAHLISE